MIINIYIYIYYIYDIYIYVYNDSLRMIPLIIKQSNWWLAVRLFMINQWDKRATWPIVARPKGAFGSDHWVDSNEVAEVDLNDYSDYEL